MDILSLAAKFLSPETQKVLSQVLPLLKEKDIAQDLTVVLSEIEKEIFAANKNPATDKSLKDAFNQAADLAAIGKDYLKSQKLSLFTAAKLAANKDGLKNNGKTLAKAFLEQQPAAMALAQSLRTNDALYSAVKRLVVKTNSRLFTLEALEDGSGNAIELLTGNNLKLRLRKEDFDEVQAALGGVNKTAPTSPRI